MYSINICCTETAVVFPTYLNIESSRAGEEGQRRGRKRRVRGGIKWGGEKEGRTHKIIVLLYFGYDQRG